MRPAVIYRSSDAKLASARFPLATKAAMRFQMDEVSCFVAGLSRFEIRWKTLRERITYYIGFNRRKRRERSDGRKITGRKMAFLHRGELPDMCFVPEGHDENSPAFQRRERDADRF